ncbi:MAG: exopolysaccharide biosynthesis polyprenyl glycosylphosphotransferase [Caulobacteraceae bacterium]|nr:exopolysaccharide biosynthesis polyprenyl glycosylphosphotransferase [Caulobacteraceae bacterium]
MSGGRSPVSPASLDAGVEPLVPDLPSGRPTWRRSGKRLFDILVSLAVAPLALPVVIAAGAAILLTMGKPVFFRQVRVGLGGRPFMILKLRTMRPGEAGGQTATVVGDARVTPLGRWLRRYHLDELPQLWNVLIGEMSLVGPRPEQPALAEAYAREAPAFAYRQLMRPGITGWAQVRAGYAADLAETRVKLVHDLFYLKKCSFALDVEICARTVWALLSGAGAR